MYNTISDKNVAITLSECIKALVSELLDVGSTPTVSIYKYGANAGVSTVLKVRDTERKLNSS